MSQIDHKLRVEFDSQGKPARYGTAGFRDLATHMPYISFRVGVFVTLLNKTQPSKSLGVVMSASHNKIQDNGLKITNFSGNMLQRRYESVLQQFVQEKDLEKAVSDFKEYLVSEGKTVFECSVNVFIGGDTRPSTPELLDLVAKGIQYQGGKVVNFKLTTTPQLQYYVYLYNTEIKPKNIQKQNVDPEELRQFYWKNFSSYYKNCMNYLGNNQIKYRCLDCANGVGGKIIPHFQQQLKEYIHLDLINNSNPENLNKKCGADFVKVDMDFPSEYEKKQYNAFVSFDGDADRIVQFIDQDGVLRLIDGDRQGTIFTAFYKKLSQDLKERTKKINDSQTIYLNVPTDPTVGFVQTYYANYSSSEYLNKTYKMQAVYAATGVKFLHEKAEHFDIGVYFEGNGHGTVIFNQSFLGKCDALLSNKDQLLQTEFVKNNPNLIKQLEDYYQFVEFYYNACKLANPSVGDAICNLLIFELALTYLGFTYAQTLKLYTDLKSRTSKIAVKSKENVRVTEIQDKVTSPAGLQQAIESIISRLGGKKAFLRPSGTQNVLRLHVQAESKELVQAITREVTAIVNSHPQLN